MASSACKNQAPRARKRIIVGLPAKQGTVNGTMISTEAACNSGILVSADGTHVHDSAAESTKKSCVLAKPAVIAAECEADSKAKTTETDSKPGRKRKSAMAAVDIMASKSVKAKKEKDPNEPKRPPTAFFLFMEDFRRNHKKANPNAKGGAAQISKEGGDKWKSMSDEDKEPFVKKCNDMKEEYQKALQIYKSNGKESIESTITDNTEEKCDVDVESCEETAASADHSTKVEE